MDIRDLLADIKPADVKVIRRESNLREAAGMMVSRRIGALLVTDEDGKLAGIVSERDLIRAIADYGNALVGRSVDDVMTKTVISCGPDDSIVDVLFLMKSNEVRHIPVLEGAKLVGIISIRELSRAYELLQAEANTDALTGLSGRRCFLETLANEFDRSRRYGHPLSVAMLDIDHFKRVNDTYGHEAGDQVLRALANILIREFRNVDRVGRLGGEEFAAIFPETNIEGADLACGRLLRMIRAAEVDFDGAKISFTVSIGIAHATPATEHPSDILKRADELMYEAKMRGRDRLQLDAPHEQPHPRDDNSRPQQTRKQQAG